MASLSERADDVRAKAGIILSSSRSGLAWSDLVDVCEFVVGVAARLDLHPDAFADAEILEWANDRCADTKADFVFKEALARFKRHRKKGFCECIADVRRDLEEGAT